MDFFSNNAAYARAQPSNANFIGAWIDLRLIASVSFHVVCDSATGTFIFEATNDENPKNPTVILPASTIVMPANYNTAAAPAAVATNFIFSFAFESANQAAMPQAAWMRCRWVRSAGGSATGLNIGVCRRGD